jgi:tetratricopeptide (TPR) repeat protein
MIRLSLATLFFFLWTQSLWPQQTDSRVGDRTPGSLFSQAIQSAKAGDLDRSIQLIDAILKKQPNYAPALKLQGIVLEQQGRPEEAALSFKRALKLTPDNPDLLYRLGVHELFAGDYPQAITLLKKHLRLRPRDGDALYYLAQAYHQTGDNSLALSSIRQSVQIDAGNPSVLQKYGELLSSSDRDDEALEWLVKARHADATLDRIDYDLAVANLNSMKFNEALGFAEKIVKANPANPVYHALLGAIELKLSMWSDAATEFQRILAEKSDDPAALLGLGQCQLELHDYPTSAKTLQQLIAIDPTQISAHFFLSRAYEALNNSEAAEQESELHDNLMQRASFTRSSARAETEEEKSIRRHAIELLQSDKEDQAITLLQQKSPSIFPTRESALVTVAQMYLTLRNAQEATRLVKLALQANPKTRGAHTLLGVEAMQSNDLATARFEFNAELKNDPNYAIAIAELGEVRYREQRWAEAVELFEKSKTSVPPFLYMLCDSYFRLGKPRDAKVTAEALASFSKNDPAMMQALGALLTRNQEHDLAERLTGESRSH